LLFEDAVDGSINELFVVIGDHAHAELHSLLFTGQVFLLARESLCELRRFRLHFFKEADDGW
jgi:hypothetical protein